MEDLISAVCTSQHCRFILYGGTSYDLVGRKGNIEIAAYLCSFLIQFVENQQQLDYHAFFRLCAREGRLEEAQGFKVSWRNGFVEEVKRRLLEMDAKIKKEFGQSTALVRITTEIQEVRDWMDENMNLGKARHLSRHLSNNVTGHRQGREAGGGVDVTGRGVKEGNGPSKQIG